MNTEALKIVRENFKMGYALTFADAMLIQQVIDFAMQAEPVTGWIKCSERMPEPHGETLLVWCRHAMQRGYYGGGNWWVIEGRWTPGERVTHWMPLPAAPEQ